MSEKVKLPSGAELDITLLPYEEAWDIQAVVAAVLERMQIDLKGLDLQNLLATDMIQFKGPILHLLSSKEVKDAAQKCFVKCTYANRRIDSQTFEPKAARGDFIPAMFHALKENISPFFGGLLSLLTKN
jgi:hypothetical protein